MEYLHNTTTLFVGTGTRAPDEPKRSSDGEALTILFIILAALIAAVVIKWINRSK